jgi:2-polyprenylphenol 6-hydroxylase
MHFPIGFIMKWMILMNKVAVYGGGVIAMTVALGLKKQGIDVSLWRPPLLVPTTDTKRVFALNEVSMSLLDALDISIKEHVTRVRRMLIWDENTGAQIEFNAHDLAQSQVAYIVEEPFLWQQTYDVLRDKQIPIIDLKDKIVHQDAQGIWHAENHQVGFLCIADGARSAMRQHLKVPCEQEPYHQIAIVAQVKMSQMHAGTAFQVFGKFGPLAFLPLADAYGYSIVWSVDTKVAKHYLSLESQAFNAQLEQALGGHLGHVEQVEGVQSYPLHMLHAQQYYGHNWMLIGDAAHQFHPLAGLGLNVGLADVKLLLKCLAENPQSFFCSTILKRYQRERRAILVPLIYAMKMIKNCFSNQYSPWVKLRSIGMDFLNHQAFLKKLMMNWVRDV